MKLLVLVPELFIGSGGIREFNRNLIKAVTELGHSINVVSINDKEDIGNTGYPFFCSNSNNYLRKPKFVINAFRQANFFRPDLIICCHVNFTPLCMVISRIFDIPFITITHGVEAWDIRGLKLYGLKNSSKIVSVSKFTRNKVLERLKDYNEGNAVIIPNTFDSDRFKPAPKSQQLMDKLGIKRNEKIILTVARLSKSEQYKGYDKVIMVLKDIISEIPDVKYLIVGDGDDKDRIEKLIYDLNLKDRVILAGYVADEEMADYYNLCDVFVMPSKGEGFGIVFLEALACGKPVIAGNKDGSVEALMDGKLGLLVDPDDIENIKEEIVRIIKNNNTQPSSILPQNIIVEEFSFNRFKQKLSEVLLTN